MISKPAQIKRRQARDKQLAECEGIPIKKIKLTKKRVSSNDVYESIEAIKASQKLQREAMIEMRQSSSSFFFKGGKV